MAFSATANRPARPVMTWQSGGLVLALDASRIPRRGRWPVVIGYDRSMPLFEGVVAVLLTAMSLLAFLELRYSVRLLPILLFECAGKLIWLAVVALHAVAAGDVEEATQEVIFSCSLVVIVLAVVPWRYVWQQYVTAKGHRRRWLPCPMPRASAPTAAIITIGDEIVEGAGPQRERHVVVG
jgi:hypothetical protein